MQTSPSYHSLVEELKTIYPDIRLRYPDEEISIYSEQLTLVYKDDLHLALLDFPESNLGILYAYSKKFSSALNLEFPWARAEIDKAPWSIVVYPDTRLGEMKKVIEKYNILCSSVRGESSYSDAERRVMEIHRENVRKLSHIFKLP